jgi:hypothetical protein
MMMVHEANETEFLSIAKENDGLKTSGEQCFDQNLKPSTEALRERTYRRR